MRVYPKPYGHFWYVLDRQHYERLPPPDQIEWIEPDCLSDGVLLGMTGYSIRTSFAIPPTMPKFSVGTTWQRHWSTFSIDSIVTDNKCISYKIVEEINQPSIKKVTREEWWTEQQMVNFLENFDGVLTAKPNEVIMKG